MDLRSGHPYWLLKNGLLASYPALKRNETCDVAVIGGGITGALVAHASATRGQADAELANSLSRRCRLVSGRG